MSSSGSKQNFLLSAWINITEFQGKQLELGEKYKWRQREVYGETKRSIYYTWAHGSLVLCGGKLVHLCQRHNLWGAGGSNNAGG
jgi:hypothetical protein